VELVQFEAKVTLTRILLTTITLGLKRYYTVDNMRFTPVAEKRLLHSAGQSFVGINIKPSEKNDTEHFATVV